VRSPHVTAGPPLFAVQALLIAGGVLLVASRFVVFESADGQTAADFGISATAWVLGVAAPWVGALLLFIAWGSAPWAGPLAVGLVLGAVLSGIDQTLGTLAVFAYPDGGYDPGLGWWLSIAGTALLIGCLVPVREAVLDAPAQVRRDWRALLATVVVAAALVAWLQAFDGFYIWFAGVESGLLLVTVCLPLTALTLSAGQRIAGLTAVTVFGAWLVAMDLHAFAVVTFLHDARSTGTALVCTLASVAACFLAQVRPPSRRPAAEVAPRR
jgi:hypothetical protein